MVNLDKTINDTVRFVEKRFDKKFNEAVREGSISYSIPEVPRDPQKFYEDLGFLYHPRLRDENNRPILVKELTPYQYEFWKYPANALAVKSQKIGLTTSCLMEDFQFTMMPEGAGKDVLIIAQNQRLANDHIRTLKKMINRSKKYSKFLIKKSQYGSSDEKTKASVIYVVNPYDINQPSRIIGLGRSESSIWSWKDVGKIHMSDVARLDLKNQKSFFAAAYSRLANTGGIIKIETPPSGQQGEVYNIYTKSKTKKSLSMQNGLDDDPESNATKFKVFEFTAREAVAAGIISSAFLEQERRTLGDILFSQLYECNFLSIGNQWYKAEWMQTGDYGATW